MKVLITGTAGFIGYHLAKHLIQRGDEVTGIDNINDYYDVELKYRRLEDTGIPRDQTEYGKTVQSTYNPNYKFIKVDLTDHGKLKKVFKDCHYDAVCNLAAQAGVRYSLSHPKAYLDANVTGFLNILEACKVHHIRNLVYASSSSVYGLDKEMPFSVHQHADHPVSLYAATKKCNELMAHTYSHLFGLPTTGLRFFTVYGPWGRPDMALFMFTKAILENKPIDVFNNGMMKRDFTYIDDIVQGITCVLDHPATCNKEWTAHKPDPASSKAPFKVFNIGRGQSVNLLDFIAEIEKNIGLKSRKRFLPLQDGDVAETWADVSDLKRLYKYRPKVSVAEGVRNFVNWYKDFYELVPKKQPEELVLPQLIKDFRFAIK